MVGDCCQNLFFAGDWKNLKWAIEEGCRYPESFEESLLRSEDPEMGMGGK
jgi:hypothetical protein